MSQSDDRTSFDWAGALLDTLDVDGTDLVRLAEAAGLDPLAGDLSHIDLSDQNIEGQDLSGWDLQHARLDRCLVARANLEGAKVSAEQLIVANGWRDAIVDATLRDEASLLAANRFLDQPADTFLISRFGSMYTLDQRAFVRAVREESAAMQTATQNVGFTVRLLLETVIVHPEFAYQAFLRIAPHFNIWLDIGLELKIMAETPDKRLRNFLATASSEIINLSRLLRHAAERNTSATNRKKKIARAHALDQFRGRTSAKKRK